MGACEEIHKSLLRLQVQFTSVYGASSSRLDSKRNYKKLYSKISQLHVCLFKGRATRKGDGERSEEVWERIQIPQACGGK